MKALTVRQPWASLIVAGVKDVENRTWPIPSTAPAVPFRLAIHAAKRVDHHDNIPAWTHLGAVMERGPIGVNVEVDRTAGCVLGLVTVTGCHRATECGYFEPDINYAEWCSPWAEHGDGVWHWTLADATPLPMPFHAKGRLGMWEVAA